MTDEAEAMFDAARRLASPAARKAFLDAACAGQPELRRQVEEYLNAQADADDLFESGAAAVRRIVEPDGVGSPGSTAASVEKDPDGLLGDRIGRYRLLQKIGEGGFGFVYMAEQEEPVRRKIALKVIKLGMDTRNVVARFEAERQALALMDHPNIARVFDGGATDTGRPYFVMELVRGLPITEYCDHHRLSTRERIEVFIDVCQAVQHAHQKGIIHRDLKPSNVLVTVNDGVAVPKVIDFGVAKAIDQRLTNKTLFTRFDALIGTPAYMSPEQAELTSLDVDTRSDIYSLGVLLYELLTGRTPFDARKLQAAGLDAMRRVIREEEPPHPSTQLRTLSAHDLTSTADRRRTDPARLEHQVRGDMDWIVMKCLEKDRARRYATVNGLAADLRRFLNHEPVVARPPTIAYRFDRWVRRNRVIFASGLAILLTLLTALGISTWLLVRETQAHGRALKAEREAMSSLEKAEVAEKARREELWRSYLTQAQAARESRRAGRRDTILAAVSRAREIRPSFELRNEAIAALAMTDLGQPRIWRDFPSPSPVDTLAAMDADFERYAIMTPTGTLSVRRVADQTEVLSLPEQDLIRHGSVFSSDGRWLAVRHANGWLNVWHLPDRQLFLRRRLAPNLRQSLDISPDSRWVAVGAHADSGPSGVIHFFALTNPPPTLSSDDDAEMRLQQETSAKSVPTHSLRVDMSPDLIVFGPSGRRMVVADTQRWQVWEWEKPRLVRSQPRFSPNLAPVAWHPDGRSLVAGSEEGDLAVWDIESGRGRLLHGHDAPVSRLAFHPRGDVIASSSWDGTTRLWDIHTGQAQLSTEHGFHRQFSRDGGQLMLYREWSDLGVWPVFHSRVFRTLVGRPGVGSARTGQNLSFSPDGSSLAWSDADGIWWLDLASGEMRQQRAWEVAWVAFDSNGSSLLSADTQTLRRWVTIRDGEAPRTPFQLGPPETIMAVNDDEFRFADMADDGRMVLSAFRSWTVIEANGSNRSFQHPGENWPYRAALSPDRKWVALGQLNGGTIVCEAQTGLVVHQWEDERRARVAFTPDGQWLVTGTAEEYRFWETGTWRPGRRYSRQMSGLGGSVAFSSDGRLMALFRAFGRIQLLDLRTGEPLADLISPTTLRVMWLAFSPDGSLLACRGSEGIHLWDLRALRQELDALRLDWNHPPYPSSTLSLAGIVFHAEAGAGVFANQIPPRSPRVSARSLDLTDAYNETLDRTWQEPRNSLAELPPGLHHLNGVDYDIRGTVHVRGGNATAYPSSVNDIRVDQPCRRLHFLGGVGFSAGNGEAVATVVIHFADDRRVEVPVVMGRDFDNWWFRPGDNEQAVDVAWTGANPGAASAGYRIRLLHFVWSNPYPEVPIKSLDFVSSLGGAAPFLAAITAE